MRQLLEWGLTNRDKFPSDYESRVPADWRDRSIVGELGRVGTRATAELLRGYLPDPSLGQLVVEAIRQIERRAETR